MRQWIKGVIGCAFATLSAGACAAEADHWDYRYDESKHECVIGLVLPNVSISYFGSPETRESALLFAIEPYFFQELNVLIARQRGSRESVFDSLVLSERGHGLLPEEKATSFFASMMAGYQINLLDTNTNEKNVLERIALPLDGIKSSFTLWQQCMEGAITEPPESVQVVIENPDKPVHAPSEALYSPELERLYNDIQYKGIYFKIGESQLLPDSIDRLNKVIEYVKAGGQVSKISIRGYMDPKESGYEDRKLSRHRADVAYNYLLNRGVPKSLMVAHYYGKRPNIKSDKKWPLEHRAVIIRVIQ